MDAQVMADEALAREAQAGALGSFEELVRRYETRLYRFLAQCSRNEADAADLTQDTFVAAYVNIGKFNPAQSFTTWVFTIARRKLIDHFRARRPAGEMVDPELADGDDPAALLARRDDRVDLWRRARLVLSEIQFEALWLRYAEEMTVEEIAAVLRRTRTHVKVTLFRARSVLAKELEGYQTQAAGRLPAIDGHASLELEQNPAPAELARTRGSASLPGEKAAQILAL